MSFLSSEEVKTKPLDKKIKIRHIEMSCDRKLECPEPLPCKSFCLALAGKPGSGKSNLLISLLTHQGFRSVFHRVEYFSPSIHTLEDPLPLAKDRFHTDVHDLPAVLKSLDPKQDNLLIFDDCLWQLNGPILKEFNKLLQNRRHYGCSICIVMQVLNRCPLAMRKLFSHVILFRTSNQKELKSIHEDQLSFLSEDQFRMVIHYCWRDDHDFIFCDTDRGRVWRNFEEEIML